MRSRLQGSLHTSPSLSRATARAKLHKTWGHHSSGSFPLDGICCRIEGLVSTGLLLENGVHPASYHTFQAQEDTPQ